MAAVGRMAVRPKWRPRGLSGGSTSLLQDVSARFADRHNSEIKDYDPKLAAN